MSNADRTVAVLKGDTEAVLGFLDPRWSQIQEGDELYMFRTITITHQLTDENNPDVSKYDSMLVEGNKIWREKTQNGTSCLYVIRGEKSYDRENNNVKVTAVEVAVELSEYDLVRGSGVWDVTTVLNTWGALFSKGNVTATGTCKYNGTYTAHAILQRIQAQTGVEFQFRYEYDPSIDGIRRYIDLMPQIGTEHLTVIEEAYNSDKIDISTDSSDVRIAAAPAGEPDSANSDFHKVRKEWEDLVITKGQYIPLYYTTDDQGNEKVGEYAYAPYAKPAGKIVECDNPTELTAGYGRIYKQKSAGGGSYPRIWTFTSTETNPYNIYWDCVDAIREHKDPKVDISCNIVDLKQLKGAESEYYNTGDIVYIRIKGRTDAIQCRITKTTKDPRNPESTSIEISNYKTSFMRDFFKNGTFKSPGAIQIS